MTNQNISQWIDNDEILYNWYKSERVSKTTFIKMNRADLVKYIESRK